MFDFEDGDDYKTDRDIEIDNMLDELILIKDKYSWEVKHIRNRENLWYRKPKHKKFVSLRKAKKLYGIQKKQDRQEKIGKVMKNGLKSYW